MYILSVKYIVLVLRTEDEQINSLFGFVHHHKDIPLHLAYCPTTRSKGHQSAECCEGASRARICARQAVFCFLPSLLHPYALSR